MADQVLVALCSSALIKYLVLYFGHRRRPNNAKLVGKISAIWYYPVKSLRGISLQEATCTPEGLRPLQGNVLDRHFLVCNPENGSFISQRNVPKMALISAEVDQVTGSLIIKAPDCENLRVPLRVPKKVQILRCRVWADHVDGVYCGEEAEKWFTKCFGRPACLVFSVPGIKKRHLQELNSSKWHALTRPDDKVAFADFGPYLLTNEHSLRDLNSRLARPVPMENFRPNIVVEGSKAFEEDNWDEIFIGDERFRHLMPCGRCVMTTVDRQKGIKDPSQEPLKTLKQYRMTSPDLPNEALFGINLCADFQGNIALGQPVYATFKTK